ncbi:hypothetical protein ACQB60_35245 [Actinomycetota bacterium Odt1-20B]
MHHPIRTLTTTAVAAGLLTLGAALPSHAASAATLTVDRTAKISADGLTARVAGTLTCAGTDPAEIYVQLAGSVGNLGAGMGLGKVNCNNNTPVGWAVDVEHFLGRAWEAGTGWATVTATPDPNPFGGTPPFTEVTVNVQDMSLTK